jgi:NADH-quinone oxidoreductase subunit M
VGVILSAAYLLTLVQKVFYGPQSEMVSKTPVLDLNGLEQLNLWPLAILMFVMGVAPNLWLAGIQASSLRATSTCNLPGHTCAIEIRTVTAGGQQ